MIVSKLFPISLQNLSTSLRRDEHSPSTSPDGLVVIRSHIPLNVRGSLARISEGLDECYLVFFEEFEELFSTALDEELVSSTLHATFEVSLQLLK